MQYVQQIFFFLVTLGVLVFVHELGHFLVAKWFKVGVLEFALGFGRKLFSHTYKETTYTIRAIPLGGFVRMTGDDPRIANGPVDEDEVGGASPIEGSQALTPLQKQMLADESRWFIKKSYWPKVAIVVAGPVFNFLFAWILATGLFFKMGVPVFVESPVTIGNVIRGLPADQAGLRSGDRLIAVDGSEVETFKELLEIVQGSEGRELAFTVRRENTVEGTEPSLEELTLTVKPTNEAKELDLLAGKSAYRIGVDAVQYRPAGFFEAAQFGALEVYSLIEMTVWMLKKVVTGQIAADKALGGPLTIFSETAKSAEAGFLSFIRFWILINVSLGLMNLLPIPVLDGGHLLLFTLEKLRGRPLSERFTATATQVGLLLLLLLMVFAIRTDVNRMFFSS